MNTDKNMLIEKSRRYVQAILDGDFDPIASNLNDELAAKLNATALMQSWTSFTKELPGCRGVLSADYSEIQGVDFVIVILDYASTGIRMLFGYDQDGKISRLSLNYAPLPSAQAQTGQSDKFTETPVKVAGDPQYPLDGMLTMPKAAAAPPVAILIQGSGSSDMNETIGSAGNAVFADLAYGLAERGISSIRYNKRFYQYPQAAAQTLTVRDEVIDDANAAIALAGNTEGIDKSKIFVIGHSLGGMLAPQIAKENPNIAGFVSMAGSPRKLEDIILDQNKAAIAMSDKTDAEKQAILDSVLEFVNQIKALTPESPHCTVFHVNSEYWLSLHQTNPGNIVKTLVIPMLYLQGGADFQVTPEADFALWQTLLKDHNNAQFKLYPDLNHLFMQTTGKADLTEYNTKANVEDQVIADIAEWIHSMNKA